MMRFNKWAVSTAAMLAMAAATPALAQQITANVSGTVTGPSGAPIAGATVTVTDTTTNRRLTTRTGASGQYGLSGLEPGGPYTITVEGEGFQAQRIDGLILQVGAVDTQNFAVTAAEDNGATEAVVVTATRIKQAPGPAATFSLQAIQEAPTIRRDIRDTLRYDPRITLQDTGVGGAQQTLTCLGGNNRSNSFTIDGVAFGDGFGLNASGFQNRFGNPYPFNATKQASIEFSPFDVQYSNFSGCVVNVVTKTGTNEFHGGGFGEFTSDGLTGDDLGSQRLALPVAKQYRWGAELGGAAIKDRVFFYVAYEEQKLPGSIVNQGPAGGGFPVSQRFFNQATLDQVANQIRTVYGYEPGGVARDLTYETRKILTRWDFILSDRHKLSFTYNRFRENNQQADDAGTNVFAYFSNVQVQGTKSSSYSARLFSQWSDKLSTELRASRSLVTDNQGPVLGGEAQDGSPRVRLQIGSQFDFNGNGVIDTANSGTASGEAGVLLAGPGFSRSANALNYRTDQIRGLVKYQLGRHSLLGGFDWNRLNVFNLFVQNATGTLSFTSVANFLNNTPNFLGTSTQGPNQTNIFVTTSAGLAAISAQGTGSADISTAAANWSRSIYSFYAQDTWRPLNNLDITLGLRYDRYFTDSNPLSNANFVRRYGFDNQQTFGGLDVFQPRFAVKWDIDKSIFGSSRITFGAAQFAGGEPAVFISNAFSQSGGLAAQALSATDCTQAQVQAAYVNGRFAGLPQCILNGQTTRLAGTRDGSVNAIDPNLKLPSVVRANFQFEHTTDFGGFAGGVFDNWNLVLSYIHSAFRNPYRFQLLSQYQAGQTSVGFPRYVTVDPLRTGCALTYGGTDVGFTGAFSAACLSAAAGTDPNRSGDILLTNAQQGGGDSDSFTAIMAKDYAYNLFGKESETSVSLGYSFTSAKDAFANNGNTTAGGSLTNTVFTDDIYTFNVAPSNFFSPHSIRLSTSSRFKFFKNAWTQFSGILTAQSGTRFSYVYGAGNFAGNIGAGGFSFYVPASGALTLGAFDAATSTYLTNDPSLRIASVTTNGVTTPAVSATAIQNFNNYLSNNGLTQYAGQIAPRNEFQNPFFFDLDLHFEQEIPTPVKGFQIKAYSNINNFLNLVGPRNNIRNTVGTTAALGNAVNFANVTTANVGSTFPVVLNQLNTPTPTPQQASSLWQVSFGLSFNF